MSHACRVPAHAVLRCACLSLACARLRAGDVVTGRAEQGMVKSCEEVVFLPTRTASNPPTNVGHNIKGSGILQQLSWEQRVASQFPGTRVELREQASLLGQLADDDDGDAAALVAWDGPFPPIDQERYDPAWAELDQGCNAACHNVMGRESGYFDSFGFSSEYRDAQKTKVFTGLFFFSSGRGR